MIRLETLVELIFIRLELFEPILLPKSDRQFPVEQFQAAVSRSAARFPPSQEFEGRGCPTELGGVPKGDSSCGRAALSREDPL